MRAERFGDLDGECAHAAPCAVDEDPLPRLQLALVTQTLQRGRPGDADGRGLGERKLRRLRQQAVLPSRRVLREGASCDAKDLVARSQSRYVLSDRLDVPGDVHA